MFVLYSNIYLENWIMFTWEIEDPLEYLLDDSKDLTTIDAQPDHKHFGKNCTF